jgi:hypothetical protein
MIRTVFKALGRRHMDVSLRSDGGHLVRIMERPGLWMGAEERTQLCADLRAIAARSLAKGALDYGVFKDDAAALNDVIITLVRRDDGTPIAFNALVVMTLDTAPQPTEVLHLGLVMVDRDERSRNLSWVLYGLTCFLVLVRRQFRPVWISNVTQVPAVAGMVAEIFSDVWPAPGDRPRRIAHLMLARQIMATRRHVFGVGDEADFDEARFVIANAYTGGSDDLRKSWEEAPKHRDPRHNDFCKAALDYDRGDDLLQLGLMDLAAMRKYLAREVPRSAVLGLLMTAALVGLRRVILPAVHWADARRQMGILRPWGDA